MKLVRQIRKQNYLSVGGLVCVGKFVDVGGVGTWVGVVWVHGCLWMNGGAE